MSEFEPEAEPTQEQPAEEPAPDPQPEPEPEPQPKSSATYSPAEGEDEMEYYTKIFDSGVTPVDGNGEPSRDLRLLAWRKGYSILRPTDYGWTTVKR